MSTGRVMLTQEDVRLDAALPLVLSRTHLSSYRIGRAFGASWASTLDQRLEADGDAVHFAPKTAPSSSTRSPWSAARCCP
ncbi:DUF6531 domain-containing protein [Amycolatopsis carbonis]|uniref:DUF6531 domain-containing protein n=1 Tax=Amycolatopsis carbonis TaxID=715471 RepID=A0A9Y2MYH8_9PSEU|nr:DUF6531 domain-containing protein [Amycolatopsis sp. 2-15]WIX80079.1 DUF6531 domain-containing protein [Amycolatopsis sp. 2-15]